MQKTVSLILIVGLGLLLAACVTTVDKSLPYEQLPTIVLASPVSLVASPSDPTSYLSSEKLPAGATVQVVGADKDAAWLLVLKDQQLGWMPAIHARGGVGNLQPALVIEPLPSKCTKYLGATFASDEQWESRLGGSVIVLGSIYRSQVGEAFDAADLSLKIEGSGNIVDSDYVHTALTPSSALILFGFAATEIEPGSKIGFELENVGEEPVAFQAAIFSSDCPEVRSVGHLAVGNLKVPTIAIPTTAVPTIAVSETGPSPTVAPAQSIVTPETTAPLLVINTESGLTETVLFDLGGYEVGDITDDIGSDLVVNEADGEKYLSGLRGDGRIAVEDLVLRGNFEVAFEADWNDAGETALLRSENGDALSVAFNGTNIVFGDIGKSYEEAGWQANEAVNLIQLQIKGNAAKLFINDQYFSTVPVSPDTVYTEHAIQGIKTGDRVFGLEIKSR